jgi:AcrR family transcriptional regulator
MTRDQASQQPVSLPVLPAQPAERADAARNRRRILDAAARVVAERGPAGLAMDEVAAAAGVGVGTVYRRFGDRAGLAQALLDAQEQRFQAAFLHGPPPLGPGAPPGERIRAFLHAYVDRLAEQAPLLAVAESDPPHARFASGAYGLHRRHLAGLIAQVRPEADADFVAEALLAPLAAVMFLHQHRDRGMSVEQIKAGLDDLLRGALAGPPR